MTLPLRPRMASNSERSITLSAQRRTCLTACTSVGMARTAAAPRDARCEVCRITLTLMPYASGGDRQHLGLRFSIFTNQRARGRAGSLWPVRLHSLRAADLRQDQVHFSVLPGYFSCTIADHDPIPTTSSKTVAAHTSVKLAGRHSTHVCTPRNFLAYPVRPVAYLGRCTSFRLHTVDAEPG